MTDYPIRVKGKIVGAVKNFEYVTPRDMRHYFYKYKGYGISESVLKTLEETGINKVRMVTPDKDLLGTVEQFKNRGLTFTYQGDFQYFVPVLEMEPELQKGQSTLL